MNTRADVWLICPRGGNSGDGLIADGCERYLRSRGLDVWRSAGALEDAALSGDGGGRLDEALATFRGLLAFPGGGNIGIYPDNGRIRAEVIRHARPHHRCLVFPQSALAPETALADPRVTVWCRDAVSEALLQRAGTRTALVPDAALFLDDTIPKRPGGRGTFFIKRTPGIDAETLDQGGAFACDSADLTFADPLDRIIATLAPYEFVISNRLHGGLIALMMRKKVLLLPVGYHKTRAFYDTWLASAHGVAFIDTLDEAPSAMERLTTPSLDLRSLFCTHADPALNRFLLDA